MRFAAPIEKHQQLAQRCLRLCLLESAFYSTIHLCLGASRPKWAPIVVLFGSHLLSCLVSSCKSTSPSFLGGNCWRHPSHHDGGESLLMIALLWWLIDNRLSAADSKERPICRGYCTHWQYKTEMHCTFSLPHLPLSPCRLLFARTKCTRGLFTSKDAASREPQSVSL